MKEIYDGILFGEVQRIPIKKVNASDYTDDQIKKILIKMRKRMDEFNSNPNQDDEYGTSEKDYQDFYDTIQKIADCRGIVI
jgi:hypothetical protein